MKVQEPMTSEAACNQTTSEWRHSTSAMVMVSIGSLLILFATSSNCFLVYAIATKRSLRKRSNALYVSLAVADILVATCVTTLALGNDLLGSWPFGELTCRLWISLDVMCCTASILSIAAVSIDRYLHIRDPFAYQRTVTRATMGIAVLAIWVLSAFISFVPINLGFHERPHEHLLEPARAVFVALNETRVTFQFQCKFESNFTYAVLSSAVSFYLPCLLVLLVYGKLYRIARRHHSTIAKAMLHQKLVSKTVCALGAFPSNLSSLNVSNSINRKKFREKKAAVTLGFIIATFLLTWTPYFIVNIVDAFDHSLVSPQIFMAVTYMGYMNSCIDPIVYIVFQVDFRLALRTSLQQCSRLNCYRSSASDRWQHKLQSPGQPRWRCTSHEVSRQAVEL